MQYAVPTWQPLSFHWIWRPQDNQHLSLMETGWIHAVASGKQHLSFTLPSEPRRIHLDLDWVRSCCLTEAERGARSKGSCAGSMREHVTDERRRQRASWAFYNAARSKLTFLPLCSGPPLTSTSEQIWVPLFADAEQCLSESSHVAFVGSGCDFNITTSLSLFIPSRRA